MSEGNKVLHREVLKPRSILLWIFVVFITILMWYQFIQQIIMGIPVGNNPAPDYVLLIFWFFFGILFPIISIFFTKLIIEVREDGLYIRYMPFHFRYKSFLMKDIEFCESIYYSPIKRFGGWGIRVNFSGEMAYTLGGNQAIKLIIKGQTVVISSRKPDEMKKAIDLVL